MRLIYPILLLLLGAQSASAQNCALDPDDLTQNCTLCRWSDNTTFSGVTTTTVGSASEITVRGDAYGSFTTVHKAAAQFVGASATGTSSVVQWPTLVAEKVEPNGPQRCADTGDGDACIHIRRAGLYEFTYQLSRFVVTAGTTPFNVGSRIEVVEDFPPWNIVGTGCVIKGVPDTTLALTASCVMYVGTPILVRVNVEVTSATATTVTLCDNLAVTNGNKVFCMWSVLLLAGA